MGVDEVDAAVWREDVRVWRRIVVGRKVVGQGEQRAEIEKDDCAELLEKAGK